NRHLRFAFPPGTKRCAITSPLIVAFDKFPTEAVPSEFEIKYNFPFEFNIVLFVKLKCPFNSKVSFKLILLLRVTVKSFKLRVWDEVCVMYTSILPALPVITRLEFAEPVNVPDERFTLL